MAEVTGAAAAELDLEKKGKEMEKEEEEKRKEKEKQEKLQMQREVEREYQRCLKNQYWKQDPDETYWTKGQGHVGGPRDIERSKIAVQIDLLTTEEDRGDTTDDDEDEKETTTNEIPCGICVRADCLNHPEFWFSCYIPDEFIEKTVLPKYLKRKERMEAKEKEAEVKRNKKAKQQDQDQEQDQDGSSNNKKDPVIVVIE
jgi:hypothetical protein